MKNRNQHKRAGENSSQISSGSRAKATKLFLLADEKWEEGDKKPAFLLFLKAAKLGEASAQHNVGLFYDIGEGVKKDKDKALYWYKKAWKNDHQTSSCINIALLYLANGQRERAIFWWKKAVNAGDGDAALDLAKLYLKSKNFKRLTVVKNLLMQTCNSKNVTEDAVEEAKALLSQVSEMRTQ